MDIRACDDSDADAIWRILHPTLRSGETYALPRDMSRDDALAYWLAPAHRVFVAAIDGSVVGTYYLKANQGGGGRHVANCGYMTDSQAQGRGVARALCEHSLGLAKDLGYRAIQFNFVVSSNERAIAIWKSFGFSVIGTMPDAFEHPRLGFVDAFVMHRSLVDDLA